MKIVCMSDTHGMHDQVEVPDGDAIVFAGDITSHGKVFDLMKFLVWLNKLPHKHKIIVAGNHDWIFQKSPDKAKEQLSSYPEIHYLQDSAITLDGIKFYGSPWQPRFFDWAFNLERGEPLRKVWEKIPDDTNVLITHGPPLGTMDMSVRDERTGCVDLMVRLTELDELRLHVFGHIHEGYGQKREGITEYVNASVCDLYYRPLNKPIVVDVEV